MDFEELFRNFQYQDLQWFVPVLAGLVVVVGTLLVALMRGMTSGVILALVLGGLLSLSPTLLTRLEQRSVAASTLPAEVARGAAELTLLNSEVVTELSSVIGTLRNAMAGLGPIIDANADVSADPAAAQLFAQSITDTAGQLARNTGDIERINRLRVELEDSMRRLDDELSSATSALQ